MNLRVGFGYDIHRLVEGRPLRLGCVEIPYERGLLGHSDGDAVAHALCDAALGAAGLGDIGQHFSDCDPTWKDARGDVLLEATRDKLAGIGARIAQADVTIVAEEPKLAPYRERMQEELSRATGCRAVSVKARTNEGVDAIGRGEAIATYAVVLVEIGESVAR